MSKSLTFTHSKRKYPLPTLHQAVLRSDEIGIGPAAREFNVGRAYLALVCHNRKALLKALGEEAKPNGSGARQRRRETVPRREAVPARRVVARQLFNRETYLEGFKDGFTMATAVLTKEDA